MSSSPLARYGVHASADSRGFSRPEFLKEAPLFPRKFHRQGTPAAPRAAPPPAPPEPLTPAPLITPPRQIQRPNSRLIVDTPDPRTEFFTRRRIRPHWDPKPPRPKPAKRPSPVASAKPETDFVTINGIQTRKRRAQDTELDLVASVNGIENIESPIVILRQGQVIPIDSPDQNEQELDYMRWNIPIVTFCTRMISNVYSAVSGLGDRIGRWMNPQSYEVAEIRAYLDNNQITNKRIKLSRDEEDTCIRWIDHTGLSDLIDDYKSFGKSMLKVWDSIQSYNSRQEMNKILQPLRFALVDNNNDRALLNTVGGNDLCDLFGLQCQRAFNALDKIYEVGIVVKIRNTHGSVPSTLDYQLTSWEAENFNNIKAFLSASTLPTICQEILKLSNKDQVRVSDSFLDRIILDLEAITHNIPVPSYTRLDLDNYTNVPGAFPDFEDPEPQTPQPEPQTLPEPISIEQPHKAPSPVLQPPEYFPPVISRPTYCKTDFMRADFLGREVAQISLEQYTQKYYHESEEHRAIEGTYITGFSPKGPLTVNEAVKLRSILKTKRKKVSSKCTPKRLCMRRIPKSVRFTDSTLSPRPRSHTGLDLPKTWKSAEEPTPATVPKSKDETPEWLKERPYHVPVIYRGPQNDTSIDTVARINEIFALPSIGSLEISDDSKAGIAIQKEQAELEAAEEARRIAEAERLAADEKARRELEERLAASGGLRMPLQTLVAAVKPEWQTRAQDTLRVAATTTLATTGEGVDLRRHDFAKVVPATEWLNDEIVNGSLNWLDQAVNSAAGIKDVKRNTRKCLAMSSFFFKRLQDQGVKQTQRTLRRYGVEKRNLLDVDTILMPICERSHWTLLVIRPSKRTVAHMDSLNPRGNASNTGLALAWMKDVLEEKFEESEWEVMCHEAPMQTNGYDCGVHTISNAMCLALGLSPVDSYAAEDMPAQRIRLACMLLNGGFKGEFDLRVY
ncbi:hypothetical protein B0J13DRAFT_561377 [Dactylonectria estremocensis]|uniref:Ubiquitin-like protease family profile domain-containing protein n=1 Tax=Dactylonectria estremocensis TaxID=1079267 RepID=A0A9P9IY61_9HYPO|nr:hypothetical protein B0J13DRAFT_561377 [Dactylonectria estremocensis]